MNHYKKNQKLLLDNILGW